MVGAALSRECIAHEYAPTEISNMTGWTEIEVLTQLHPSSSLSDRVMVEAALSREFIAHEYAPTEISNMTGWEHAARDGHERFGDQFLEEDVLLLL
jgi:hypothetical protein